MLWFIDYFAKFINLLEIIVLQIFTDFYEFTYFYCCKIGEFKAVKAKIFKNFTALQL